MSPVSRVGVVARWAKRLVLGVLGVVVVAIAFALIALHTDWGREQVRKIAVSQMNTTFVGGADIGAFEGSPFGEIVLRDLVINGPDGQPAIRVGALHLQVELTPLISHRLVLDHIAMDDVDVVVKHNPDGSLQLADLTKPGPPSTWNISLPDVELHRGHIEIDPAAVGGERLDLDDVLIDAAARLPKGNPDTDTIGATAVVHANVRQRGAVPVDVALRLTSDVRDLNVPSALISVGGASVAVADFRMAKADASTDGNAAPASPTMSGIVAVHAPHAAVAQLLPGVELPPMLAHDASLAVIADAPANGPPLRAAMFARLGDTTARGFVIGDLAAKTGRGLVIADGVDAGALTGDKVAGIGGALVTFAVTTPPAAPGELPVADAIATIWADVHGAPPTKLAIALSSGGDHVRAVIGATTPGASLAVGASVRKHGDQITLEASRVVASVADPARVSPKAPAVHGTLSANIEVHGEVSPKPMLAVAGHAHGAKLRFQDASIQTLALAIDGHDLPSAPLGSAKLALTGVAKGTTLALDTLTIQAANQADHSVAFAIDTKPKWQPWLIDADGTFRPGETMVVELAHHHVRVKGVDWRGDHARFEVGPRGIAIDHLNTASTDGALALAMKFTHGAAAGHLTVDATASLRDAAKLALALDTDTPAAIGDIVAWRHLARTAVRRADIDVDADVAKTASYAGVTGYSGTFGAHIAVDPDDVRGTVSLAKLTAPPLAAIGTADAKLELDQRGRGDASATVTASVEGIGGVHASASVATPPRMFDPVSWKALGPSAFKGATIALDEIAIDPTLLQKVHSDSPLRAKVDLAATIAPAVRSVELAFDVHQLHGGGIAKPIELHVGASADDRGATVAVRAGAANTTLLDGKVAMPVALAALIANPRAVTDAAMQGTVTMPEVQVKDLLAAFGRSDIVGGTLGGTIKIGGTVTNPTGHVSLAMADVTAPPGVGSREPQIIRKLTLDADWNGDRGKLAIVGSEASGGTLKVTADAAAKDPRATALTVTADKFDLRPIAAFLPGVGVGIAGKLDAKLSVKGLDPRTADVAGTLTLTNARVPIAPQIGTLREANVKLEIANKVVSVDAKGKLGHDGTLSLVASAPLENGAPTGGKATLTLRKVSPIGAVQPVIDSDISATIARGGDGWTADVHVDHTFVSIPDTKGSPLDPVGVPSDIHYEGKVRGKGAPTTKVANDVPTDGKVAAPPHPILVAKIAIGDVTLESADGRGVLKGQLQVSLGEASAGGSPVGLVGQISAERGQVELFDRRYEIDHAAVNFDGSIDPLLDIRISYDFPDVTTITEIHGRLSKPELVLTSEPGQYSQADLLGFLLGGEPNGDPSASQSAMAKAQGAGVGLVANQLGGYVKKALPIKVDTIKYEAATATNSAAVTVGDWINHTLFVAYRRHLEPLPDENEGEGDAEYYIRPRLMLDATLGDRGYDGLDLLWRKRW